MVTLNYAISQVLTLSAFKGEVLEFGIGAGQSLWDPWAFEMFGGLNDSNYFKTSTSTTPSAGTGPTSLPPIGNFYCFTESSNPYFGARKFAMARRDLSKVKSIYFIIIDTEIACVILELNISIGVDWLTELTLTGDSGNVWIEQTVEFSDYNSIQNIRLV